LLIWLGVNHKVFLEQLVSDRTRELDERIKELSCMQRVARDLQAMDSVELISERILVHLRQAFEDPSRVFPSIDLDGVHHALAEEPENPDLLIQSDLMVSGKERGRLRIALLGGTAFLKEEQELADQVSHALSLWLERKESVVGLQNSLAWQEAIFEGSRDAVFISDMHSRFVSVNTSACLLTGYSREELLSMRIQDLHEEVDLDAYRTYHQKILGGEQVISETRIRRKDGKKVDTSFNNQRIIVEGSTYMHSSARDITANKQAEMELIRAKERAEESDRLKTAFLNNLSHEVRTPLNAIVGFSDVLDLDNEEASPGRIQHLTAIIRNSSQQLLSIIDDIINISTLEAGLQKSYETRTDIRELVQGVYDQYTMAASKKDLRFSIVQLPAEKDSHVLTDKTKVQQILGNLVGNALKFTETGKVAIGCVMKDGFLRFSVTDTGIGIDPVHRDLVFERFRQVETNHSRVKGGLGLGLSISRAFVELLGGKIWYESEKGSGSSFYFTIPFRPVPAPESTGIEPDTFRLAESRTILVAEDEENNFELIREFLDGSGLRILHARNGKEAVEIFKKEKDISLVIMDIKMPVMGGFEATAAIKAIRSRVPVIAVTAYAQSGDRKKSLEAGCDDYMSKPLTRKGFLSKLRSFLERN
jgi:PAS domain S-box-containing protein